ncbi:hypothetical protein EDC94DRAFT_449 [Helicostylum pulchrum]|nr:hypothetical protein EDC94DRAFT_449 [Helicostylum pulchrum]
MVFSPQGAQGTMSRSYCTTLILEKGLHMPLPLWIESLKLARKILTLPSISYVISSESSVLVLSMKGSSRYGVTVFHAYGHKFGCQVEFNLRYIPGFRMTDGEGMMRFWSYLSGYIKLKQRGDLDRWCSVFFPGKDRG